MSVVDAEAKRLAVCFGVSKFVNEVHTFNQIATDASHNLEEVVLIERVFVVEPEGNIFVAGGVL